MYAWLVVNEYLKSKKFDEIYEYLISAAKDRGCVLEKLTNYEVLTDTDILMNKKPDFVIFWDKDVKAAALLEHRGLKLYNSSRAIEVCDDKSLTYISLVGTDIKMPKTMVSPLTFGLEDSLDDFIDSAINTLGLPFIIKENCGSFGAQVYKAGSREEAIRVVNQIGKSDFIVQEFIANSQGRDVRINMVGDKPAASMMRTNDSDFRANITNGGKMKNYQPTDAQVDMAKKVCEYLNLDFAGVDILFGENDEPILCEVNSNAHFKNILDCTGVNVAQCILDYIIGDIKKDEQ